MIALIRREQENGTLLGCIVQYGGQTPLKLSQALDKAGIPILGTSAEAIDIAEVNIRKAVPAARVIYLEPDILRSSKN